MQPADTHPWEAALPRQQQGDNAPAATKKNRILRLATIPLGLN